MHRATSRMFWVAGRHTSGGTETNGDKTVYTVRAGDSFETALGLSDVTAVVIEGVEFPLK